jgi:hypothetical protein
MMAGRRARAGKGIDKRLGTEIPAPAAKAPAPRKDNNGGAKGEAVRERGKRRKRQAGEGSSVGRGTARWARLLVGSVFFS